MTALEDVDMRDADSHSAVYHPRPFKESLNNAPVSSNGIGPLVTRNDQPSGVPKSGSRENSVLARARQSLNHHSPPLFREEDSEDELSKPTLAHAEPLPYRTLKTGLCYDPRMRFHTELIPPKERAEYHPEDPRRILHIYRTLCEAGLVIDGEMTVPPVTENPMYRIMPRSAKREEICLVHDQEHFEFIRSTSAMSEDDLSRLEKTFDSIYFHPQTYLCALLSTGGAIETCIAVATGVVKNAIAVIRPPGHHAECKFSKGFCHFDNVSIATQVVRKTYPDQYRKVLIVDWDVHHGNGIQQAFESDPNVLYISIHVHENGNFYPTGPYGDMYHCGIGPGIGKNINIPWPVKGMGDADYLFAFQHIIMPVAYDFNPDMVIIAAGFDAAVGDQLGGCFVTPACYGHMTHMLMSLAKGKVVVCLEGGYNLDSIAKSALAVTKTLMGEPPDRMQETAATKIGVETVKKVILQQSKYWKCLYPKGGSLDVLPNQAAKFGVEVAIISGAERMHNVVRAYQSKQLHQNHKMICLWIFREVVSQAFDDQVLATKNYDSEVPLLVIFHDPPEVIGVTSHLTGKLDLHNTWLADMVKHYITWAIDHGFGIIDVNVPHYLDNISDDDGDDEEELQKVDQATDELAQYLWENYIEPNQSPGVIFMGVGHAYRAVLHILNTQNQSSLEKISGVVGFISESSLHPVVETFILELGRWYTRHSLIYVSNNHPVWEREKKPGKRFGNLRRSSASTINTMMEAHQAEVEEFLEATGNFLQENMSASNAEGSIYGSTMMTRTGSAGSRTIG